MVLLYCILVYLHAFPQQVSVYPPCPESNQLSHQQQSQPYLELCGFPNLPENPARHEGCCCNTNHGVILLIVSLHPDIACFVDEYVLRAS